MKCRLTPGVSLRADIFGPPEGVMSWEVAYESDDEGVVRQPSFAAPTTILEDDGPRIRPPEEDQEWRRMYGPVRSSMSDGPRDLTVESRIMTALAEQFFQGSGCSYTAGSAERR